MPLVFRYAALHRYCQQVEQELIYILYQWLPLKVERFRPLHNILRVNDDNGRVGNFELGGFLGKRAFAE